MRIFSGFALGIFLFLGGLNQALAEFPSHNVQIIVPVGTGGGNDIIARLIADQLQKKWNKSVIVLNKPGAGTALAESFVAHSPTDGHTILIEGIARTINAAAAVPDSGYDAVNGLAPVTQIGKQPYVLLASKKLGVKSLSDLVALAKAKPNIVNYGDSGRGTNNDLAMKRVMLMTGTNLYEISYKALAEVLVAMLGGEVDIAFGDLLSSTPHIKSGALTPLAVTDDVRTPVFPNVPTFSEAFGGDPFVYTAWFGVFVPAGTPKEIIDQLNQAIVAAIKLPEIKDKLASDGFQIIGNKPDEFDKVLKTESATWHKVMDAFK